MTQELSVTQASGTKPQAVGMCAECGIALVTDSMGRSAGSATFGALLIFVGIIALFIKVIVALLLTISGVLLMSIGGRRLGLICPHCGARGTTLRQLARRARRHLGELPSRRPQS